MDAFYASVEQRDNPDLRGKPLAVGGHPDRRGVVAAASYEARAFGVRSAMSMARAVRLCPSLVIVAPDFSRYKAASTAVFSIFGQVTPLVEPMSLDEAYLDVTENAWNEPLATTVARRLKERIRGETGLTASAGVAPNKFLAKIASGSKKPDGLTVIRAEIAELASHAANWLPRKALVARPVTIKVRYSDFTTITRSHTAAPTRDEATIVARAVQLLDRTKAGSRPVRLLGVSVHNFCGHPDVAVPADRLPFDDDLPSRT